MNSYKKLGAALLIIGVLIALFSNLVIRSVPLTAIGLSAIVVGLTSLFLASSRPGLSPEVCQLLMETGVENTSAILEKIGVKSKAIYVPRSMSHGHSRALVPLEREDSVSQINGNLPGILIETQFGSVNKAFAITALGNISLSLLKSKPGPTADEIESSMAYLLTGMLDIANKVKLDMAGSQLNIKVTGVEIGHSNCSYYQCLGSPIASIAAAVSCEALQKPVRITSEIEHKKIIEIQLEVLT